MKCLLRAYFEVSGPLHLLSCGWNGANNLACKHAPHFAALPSNSKTTPMAISCEGSGSEMDFSAVGFVLLRISVSKAGTE